MSISIKRMCRMCGKGENFYTTIDPRLYQGQFLLKSQWVEIVREYIIMKNSFRCRICGSENCGFSDIQIHDIPFVQDTKNQLISNGVVEYTFEKIIKNEIRLFENQTDYNAPYKTSRFINAEDGGKINLTYKEARFYIDSNGTYIHNFTITDIKIVCYPDFLELIAGFQGRSLDFRNNGITEIEFSIKSAPMVKNDMITDSIRKNGCSVMWASNSSDKTIVEEWAFLGLTPFC